MCAIPALIEAYGAAGRDRALSRYSWNRIAAATAEVYGAVIEERAANEPMARNAR